MPHYEVVSYDVRPVEGDTQIEVVIQELPPLPHEIRSTERIGHRLRLQAQRIADQPRTRPVRTGRTGDAVAVVGRHLAQQPNPGAAPLGVIEVVARAIDGPDFLSERDPRRSRAIGVFQQRRPGVVGWHDFITR